MLGNLVQILLVVVIVGPKDHCSNTHLGDALAWHNGGTVGHDRRRQHSAPKTEHFQQRSNCFACELRSLELEFAEFLEEVGIH